MVINLIKQGFVKFQEGSDLWSAGGEGPGKQEKLFSTKVVGKSYQELALTCDSADYCRGCVLSRGLVSIQGL